MILSATLGALAGLSFVLLLWQWLAARRFPLHRRSADAPGRRPALPPVTLLKPIKGCDEYTEVCLRSWFAQEYPGEIQILFAVAAASDPACAVIEKLRREFPARDAQLMVCPERFGANAKVSKLAQLEPHVKHEIIVISDADVKVPADLLANAVGMLDATRRAAVPAAANSDVARLEENESSGGGGAAAAGTAARRVGLVNCFYQLANATTPAMRWEAVAVNADFWSQVLQGRSLKPLDFALGAVMVTRRKQLAEIGGFRALAECLADDYQLGNRIAKLGYRVELCPAVVECWDAPMGWGAVWRHQVRWARTIRVCQPLPYFFSILSNATLWPLLYFAAAQSASAMVIAGVIGSARILAALDCQARLTRSGQHIGWFWLVPLKDLLQVAIWAAAFAGNRIEWRGEKYRLRPDGTLQKV